MSVQLQSYFGRADALMEENTNILLHHVDRSWEEVLKAFDRSDGKQIIVGIKGSGKTELRRYIETTDGKPVFNLDSRHGYLRVDAQEISSRSGVLMNVLAVELLRVAASSLGQEGKGLKAAAKAKLKAVSEGALEMIKNVPDAVKVGAPFVEVDLSKLTSSSATQYVTTAWERSVRGLVDALKGTRAYIMIDDVEDVFPGIEDNPPLLEGLFRAVAELNDVTRERLHVLVFVKYGAWRQVFEHPQDYDKVTDFVHIVDWEQKDLPIVIARRIARLHGMHVDHEIQPDRLETIWALDFQWAGTESFNQLTELMVTHCVSGPRDMIALSNKAKELAGAEKISIEHIEAVLEQFSQEKLYGLSADFGDVYPGISEFVGIVLADVTSEMPGMQFVELLESNALTNSRVEQQFGDRKWFAQASKYKLASIMYEIGVVGVRRYGELLYSLRKPRLSQSELTNGTIVIHPAFRPQLHVRESPQSRKAANRR